MLKNVFREAANAAEAKTGPLKDLSDRCVDGGVRATMTKLNPGPQDAAIVLRLWKKGELRDPEKLTIRRAALSGFATVQPLQPFDRVGIGAAIYSPR